MVATLSIKTTRTTDSGLSKIDFNHLPFGQIFSDHMFVADYINGQWTNLEIKPLENLVMHPGLMALHYGQSIFEGMKAFKSEDGRPILFRPEKHVERINKSAERLCMPPIPEEIFIEGLTELVKMDQDFIPTQPGASLYIRPFMFATDHTIGVRPSSTYKFIIFTSPVGPYYSEPVKLLAQDKYVRAVVGGVGEAKAAGNYAASLLPAQMAKEEGYDQVMWLDGVHKKFIQEVGTMNIFFVINGEIVTPALDGAILKGITRDSLITVLKDLNYKVSEKELSIDEIIESYKNGLLTEIFGTGTAVVVAPVKALKYKDIVMELDNDERKVGPMLYNYISDLRTGKIEDKFGWVHYV